MLTRALLLFFVLLAPITITGCPPSYRPAQLVLAPPGAAPPRHLVAALP